MVHRPLHQRGGMAAKHGACLPVCLSRGGVLCLNCQCVCGRGREGVLHVCKCVCGGGGSMCDSKRNVYVRDRGRRERESVCVCGVLVFERVCVVCMSLSESVCVWYVVSLRGSKKTLCL